MEAAGDVGLGATLRDLLADAGVGGSGAFLAGLIRQLDAQVIANVLENGASGATLTTAERNRLPFVSPVSGEHHTMLEVTWFYVYLKAHISMLEFLGLADQEGWAWSLIEGGEYENDGSANDSHWEGPAWTP